MDARDFVARIKATVRNPAVADTIRILQLPPGRRPRLDLLQHANWYRSLPQEQQEMLAAVVASAVDRALFGLFCVLDGVRVVEDGETKGDFQLNYVRGTTATQLNSIDEPPLHDLYNDPEVGDGAPML